jgi:hypothetical protein
MTTTHRSIVFLCQVGQTVLIVCAFVCGGLMLAVVMGCERQGTVYNFDVAGFDRCAPECEGNTLSAVVHGMDGGLSAVDCKCLNGKEISLPRPTGRDGCVR